MLNCLERIQANDSTGLFDLLEGDIKFFQDVAINNSHEFTSKHRKSIQDMQKVPDLINIFKPKERELWTRWEQARQYLLEVTKHVNYIF